MAVLKGTGQQYPPIIGLTGVVIAGISVAESIERSSNSEQERDRVPGGQPAPAEGVAKRLSVSEKVAGHTRQKREPRVRYSPTIAQPYEPNSTLR